jgi:hypothetical protein
MVTAAAIRLELKSGGAHILVGRMNNAPALPATDPKTSGSRAVKGRRT